MSFFLLFNFIPYMNYIAFFRVALDSKEVCFDNQESAKEHPQMVFYFL